MTESEEVYAFFHHVGVALSQWANVEMQLEYIAHLSSREGHIGFRAIENFRSKAAYVDALVRHKHEKQQKLLAAWLRLYSNVTSAANKRNELVHKTPMRLFGPPGSRIALLSLERYDTSVKDPHAQRVRDGLKLRDVAHRALEFRALYVDLDYFAETLASPGQAKPLRPPVPPVRRLTMKQIEAQMREALGRQPRPSGSLPEQKKVDDA